MGTVDNQHLSILVQSRDHVIFFSLASLLLGSQTDLTFLSVQYSGYLLELIIVFSYNCHILFSVRRIGLLAVLPLLLGVQIRRMRLFAVFPACNIGCGGSAAEDTCSSRHRGINNHYDVFESGR